MSLQDHFHPPLSVRRHWHAFHNSWATYLSSDLNRRLPEGYFAEANVQFGIEIDVAAFEESAGTKPILEGGWTPSSPTQNISFSIANETVEVEIYRTDAGPTLAGAVELVSPSNKDRPAHREAFLSKCIAYLNQGVGLIVIDVVTERGGNLHDDLLARLGMSVEEAWNVPLYAAAYRPVERDGRTSLDIWQEALAIGRALPTMPLWLRGDLCLPVEFEAAYERTCLEQRVTANSV